MPYEVKGNELVAVKDAPSELFVQFERADEDQIVATMQGAALEEYVYEFGEGANKVIGLSWVGTREAARHQGGIHISQPQITETEDAFTVIVSAHDRIRDVVVWGGSSQEKKQTFRNGGSRPDPFAFQKALSKAQRNAMMAVLPTVVIVKMIEAYRQRSKNVRRVSVASKEEPSRRKPEPEKLEFVPIEQNLIHENFVPDDAEIVEAESVTDENAIPAEVRSAGAEMVDAFVTVRKSLRAAATLDALKAEWTATLQYLGSLGAPKSVGELVAGIKEARKAELAGQTAF